MILLRQRKPTQGARDACVTALEPKIQNLEPGKFSGSHSSSGSLGPRRPGQPECPQCVHDAVESAIQNDMA